jgi:hypothetical protein
VAEASATVVTRGEVRLLCADRLLAAVVARWMLSGDCFSSAAFPLRSAEMAASAACTVACACVTRAAIAHDEAVSTSPGIVVSTRQPGVRLVSGPPARATTVAPQESMKKKKEQEKSRAWPIGAVGGGRKTNAFLNATTALLLLRGMAKLWNRL